MRVAITGATGNVGTSLVGALASEPAVDEIIGIARRRADLELPKTTWVAADITSSDLGTHFRGIDVVVHLAWLIQPSRDLGKLRRTNVNGSERVFRAAASAGAGALVYASSVGAYSPGPKDETGVDETWPTEGIPTSFYSRHKAETERLLDSFEKENPATRVVRMRPALIFKKEAAASVRRLFAGPFLPGRLLRRHLIPVIPNVSRLRFQCVHSYDIAEAYRLAITTEARGAYNVAADPVLDPDELADLLDARQIRLPQGLVRAGTTATWRLHLQPTPPGWMDMAVQTPILDSSRVRAELGWSPRRTSREALMDLLDGLRDGSGMDTPPLHPKAGGPLRIRELLSGVGRT